MNANERLAEIEAEIKGSAQRLKTLHDERTVAQSRPEPLTTAHPLLAAESIKPRSFCLVAQGDSWFDYPGQDLINWLRDRHGHQIDNIAVAGSTLNDIVYGKVPKNWLGIPQSHDTSRSAELINLIAKKRPDGVLLSGGGNDIAGPEFFTFVNNALSGLGNPNKEVLDGVVAETFTKAYTDLLGLILEKAHQMGMLKMKVFVHGYDHPFPDGRGFTAFNFVGPWFHDSFNKKNYPYDPSGPDAAAQLKARRDIVAAFIDSFNIMLAKLVTEPQFTGRVHYMNLRDTLPSHADWANELHPKQDGFRKLAAKIDVVLHKELP
ncbi:MAG TPA: hypothetical protein DDZ88_19105 [Verrucomicrobiales bacterium]|nr:hypothetical protein [Verrucomicrobiales bacterium]